MFSCAGKSKEVEKGFNFDYDSRETLNMCNVHLYTPHLACDFSSI